MRTIFRGTLFATLAAVTSVALAGEEFDPAARAAAVAPFIDEQTVAVVHVDLARIEIDPLVDKFLELVPEAAGDMAESRAEIRQGHARILQAGAGNLYVVVSLADLPRWGPFCVIPNATELSPDALLAAFPGGKNTSVEPLKGSMLMGPLQTLERVKTLKPDPRPELAEAFQAAGDTAAQLLVLPPKDTRRVVEEMTPELPKEVGGGPSTILTRGLLWAAVGADAPPKTSLRVVIQSEDHQAAAALRGKWLELVRFLSTYEEARRRLRDFEKATSLMTPNVEGDRLVLTLRESDGSINALFGALTPPIEQARARAQRSQSTNNLKQLALAMHNHHDTHKSFPAVGNADASGKLLLSWRVHILPYVEQQKLYEQFHLDEPWDSEHNRRLIEQMPETFRCPASKLKQEQGLSTYRVVSGEGTVFPGREGIPIKEIRDGTSNTIMIVEVDDQNAVIWTKPEGLPFDPKNPAKGLGGQFEGGFDTAFCDGSVHFISKNIPPETLRLLLLRSDGKPVSNF
jgi:hypothetical protein